MQQAPFDHTIYDCKDYNRLENRIGITHWNKKVL